jgi:hypothetical protein
MRGIVLHKDLDKEIYSALQLNKAMIICSLEDQVIGQPA